MGKGAYIEEELIVTVEVVVVVVCLLTLAVIDASKLLSQSQGGHFEAGECMLLEGENFICNGFWFVFLSVFIFSVSSLFKLTFRFESEFVLLVEAAAAMAESGSTT